MGKDKALKILTSVGFYVPNDNEYLKSVQGIIIRAMQEYAEWYHSKKQESELVVSKDEINKIVNKKFPVRMAYKPEIMGEYDTNYDRRNCYYEGIRKGIELKNK
jgi:hypothetical protein